MRPGKRHGHKLGRCSDPKALADSLPGHHNNPNGCVRWETVDEHQRAVADYLRTEGVSADLSAQLAPDVSDATGVAFCIFLRDRLIASAARSRVDEERNRPAVHPVTDDTPEPSEVSPSVADFVESSDYKPMTPRQRRLGRQLQQQGEPISSVAIF